MKAIQLCISVIVIAGFFSCAAPPADEPEVEVTPIPRLAKYFPEISASGDTTGYFHLPTDQFVNQYGDTIDTKQAQGKISVTQFFFSSCEGICPIMSGNMSSVQKAFAGNTEVRLLSFSVDPERDSVPALKKYADRFHCDSLQWMLFTGEKKKIYDHARYGYRLPAIEPGDGGEEDFIHSDMLVLVDRESVIRGYYVGTDTAQVRMLIEDVNTLLKQK